MKHVKQTWSDSLNHCALGLVIGLIPTVVWAIDVGDQSIRQESHGACSQNIVALGQARVNVNAMPECGSLPNMRGLTKYEAAQFRLLLAKNPTTARAQSVRIAGRFPGFFDSPTLWVDISNIFELPAMISEVTILPSSKGKMLPAAKNNEKLIEYSVARQPDVLFSSRQVKLEDKDKIGVKLLSVRELRERLHPPQDYCLVDISVRADDQSLEGYDQAYNRLLDADFREMLQAALKTPEGESGPIPPPLESSSRSIPFVVSVKYKSIFDEERQSITTFFTRYVKRGSSHAFYPSRMEFDSLKCLD